MAEQKVKVKVADLITRVEAFKKKQATEHARLTKEHETAKAAFGAKMIAALEAALAKAKKGEYPAHNYSQRYDLVCAASIPPKPTALSEVTAKIDADLSLLRMAADDTIMVSTETRWGRYL